MVEGARLESECTLAVPWVRIPPPPLSAFPGLAPYPVEQPFATIESAGRPGTRTWKPNDLPYWMAELYLRHDIRFHDLTPVLQGTLLGGAELLYNTPARYTADDTGMPGLGR